MPRMSRPKRRGARDAAGGSGGGQTRQLWVLEGGVAVPYKVTVGISDGRSTEVTGGDLAAGMEVITDQRSSNSSSKAAP